MRDRTYRIGRELLHEYILNEESHDVLVPPLEGVRDMSCEFNKDSDVRDQFIGVNVREIICDFLERK